MTILNAVAEYIFIRMREDSNGAKEGLLQCLKLTVLIDKQDAYQFMLRCGQTTTVRSLIKEMAQAYDWVVQTKGLFRDRECNLRVSPEEKAKNSDALFLDLTSKEYESIVKSLFFSKPSIKGPSESPQATGEKVGHGQISTAAIINEESSPHKQVSEFEVDNKVRREQNIKHSQMSAPAKTGAEYLPQQEPLVKTNSESFGIAQTQLLASDGLKRPETVGGDCCALI